MKKIFVNFNANKMKNFTLLLLLFLAAFAAQGQTEAEKESIKKAVNQWADKTFVEWDSPRFEKFKPQLSPDYYALTVQKQMLEEFKEEIVFNFNESKSDRTLEEVKEDTAKTSKNIKELEKIMEQFPNKYKGYEVYWWANIKTNNGLTVYYQHLVKLDEHYKVVHAKVSSYIGKDRDDIKILYK